MPLTPRPNDHLLDWFRRVEGRLDENDRRTLYSVVISSGGLTIQDLGGIKMLDNDGEITFFTGGADGDWVRPDGTPQPITYIADDRGHWRIAVFDPQPRQEGYRQFVAIWDHSGNIILGDDAHSGAGLARPYIPLSVSGVFQDWPVTKATEWTTLEQIRYNHQHPKIKVDVRIATDHPDTFGEIRLWADPAGVQVGETRQVRFLQEMTGFRFTPPTRWAEMGEIWLQARRTSGSGGTRACIAYASGEQT
ncbi:hypothetical protein M8C13_06315 [Crossiella sp. SN42]|uniref:hypothetical protein n=1 Tax=Crossiella sp. SN42 TaxID=2944808 RepID=UPI00207D6C2F|nr:hypothetical protein [Crossiella sp. SN42]MCO1575374.1 hypothetical protein [Crossiella sp. SN42]